MKKFFYIIFLFVLISGVFPQDAFSLEVPAGLVPCGTDIDTQTGAVRNPCAFGDLAGLFQNVMQFLLIKVMVPLATLAIVFVGIQYLTAAGNPSKLTKAHDTLWDVLYGIIIAIAAYAIVETIFIILTNYQKLPGIK